MSKRLVITPDIEAAIADVRAAAAAFGEETAYFANGTSDVEEERSRRIPANWRMRVFELRSVV